MKTRIFILTLCLGLCITIFGQQRPYFLQSGDTLAVISPSALPTVEQVERTVSGLMDWGYVPVKTTHVCDSVRSLQDCYDDVMRALRNPNIKALFCVRGGFGSSEVMDMIPLDTLRKYPKMVVGYSDITAMHSAWISAGLTSIHATMADTWKNLPDTCVTYEKALLRGELPTYHFEGSALNKEGEAEGVLIGGNLSIFCMTVATHYDPTRCLSNPYILILEDIGESWQATHRYLTILKHLGILDNAQAILYGEWTDMFCNESDYNGSSRGGRFAGVNDMIARQFDLSIPQAYNLPFGHDTYNYPLLMGETVKVKIAKDGVTLTY